MCGACRLLPGPGTEPGITVRKRYIPFLAGRGAAEADEAFVERDFGAVVVGTGVAAGGVGLPDLDHGVGHGSVRRRRRTTPSRMIVSPLTAPLGGARLRT
jgi:hypothetical protein